MLTYIYTTHSKFHLSYTPAKRGSKEYLYELFFLGLFGFYIGMILFW